METFQQFMNWFFAALALAVVVIGYLLYRRRKEQQD